MAESISPAALSRMTPILTMRVFAGRRYSNPRPISPGSISPPLILVLAPPGSFCLTFDTKVLRRLSALRKDAQEKEEDDRERDLYLEERKAELGIHLVRWFEDLKRGSIIELPFRTVLLIIRLLWIGVMVLCWALADYGRSFVRPAAWLALSVPFFYFGYLAVLAPLVAKAPDIEKYKQAVQMLALGNTVPFGGSLTGDAELNNYRLTPVGS